VQYLTLLLVWALPQTGLADTHWSTPNKLGLTVAMTATSLTFEHTSMLLGHTTWRSDPTGVIHPHGSLEWRGLTGQEVIPLTVDEQPTRMRFCQTATGHDPVPGDRVIHLYRADDPDAPTSLVLGTAPEHEVLLVSLQPGDTLQLTQVSHTSSGRKMEHISMERAGETLSLSRGGKGAQACYTSAS
jgi:hypothetical protein